MNLFASRKRTVILIMALAVAAVFLIWLSASANYTKMDDGYSRIIGVSQFSLETSRQNAFKQSALEASARYLDLNVLFANAGTVAEKQAMQIESFLIQKIDVLIVDAPDFTPLEASLQKAHAQGVALVLIGDTDTTAQCDMLVAIDYFAMGKAAGEHFLSLDPVPISILEIQGTPRSRQAMQLQSGFRAAIKDSGSRIDFVIAGYDSVITAKQRVVDSHMAQAEPPINGMFVHDEEMTSGVAKVLPDIPSVSIGVAERTGRIPASTATVSSSSGGGEAIGFALDLLAGKTDMPRQYTPPVGLELSPEESAK